LDDEEDLRRSEDEVEGDPDSEDESSGYGNSDDDSGEFTTVGHIVGCVPSAVRCFP